MLEVSLICGMWFDGIVFQQRHAFSKKVISLLWFATPALAHYKSPNTEGDIHSPETHHQQHINS